MVNLMYKKQLTFLMLMAIILCQLGAVNKLLAAEAVDSTAKKQASADTILDKLEKYLLDQERKSQSFQIESGTNATASSSKDLKKVDSPTIYSLPEQDVKTDLPEVAKLAEISTAIMELENKVDQLGAGVQKTKQKILEQASIGNKILIEAGLSSEKTASLRSLSVFLDDFEIYQADDQSGIWMPSNSIPVYFGPMLPGDHQLSIKARMVLKGTENLALHTNKNRELVQSFKVSIPPGEYTKRMRVEISPSANNESPSTATLKETTAQ